MDVQTRGFLAVLVLLVAVATNLGSWGVHPFVERNYICCSFIVFISLGLLPA